VGKRSLTPLTASSTIITARDIQAVPLRTSDDILRLVPGLTLVQHGSEGKGQQFFLRGFDAVHGSDFEVTVLGIPLNEWSNVHGQGYVDLGFVIPETVQSVEVIKGPFTLRQGAFATAGSANYRLGIAEADRGLRVSTSYGTTHRLRGVVTYSPQQGDGQNFLALEGVHDDGYGQNRAVARGSLLGQFKLFGSPETGTLTAFGAAYLANFELAGTVRNDDYLAGRIGFYDTYDDAQRGESSRGLGALRYLFSHARMELEATAYAGVRRLALLENYTGFLLDEVNGDRRGQRQQTFNFGGKLRLDFQLHRRLSLETGLELRGDVLNQTQDHLGQEEQTLSVERQLAGVQTLSSVLLGLRVEPHTSLRISVGGRLDIAQIAVQDGLDPSSDAKGSRAALSPRAVVEWDLTPKTRFFAAFGRGFRPPEARAFTTYKPPVTGISEDLYRGGNPQMTLTNSAELGTRLTPSRYLGAQLSGFATYIERESIYDHVSGLNLELNGTRRLGGEIDLHSQPFEWLTLAADLTLVDARFVESQNPIPLAPWLTTGARAMVEHGGFRGGLRFIGIAPRPLPHGATGSSYALLDATLGYRYKDVSFDLALENILNLKLREGEYHFASDWPTTSDSSAIPAIQYVAGPPFNARLGVTLHL